MITISAADLTLQFGTVTIFENVSFSLNENDRMGVIGINGCGKTSLFRTLTSEYEATSGQVFVAGEKTLGYVAQDSLATSNDGNETVLEHMYGAFPELLAAEAELAELEARMNAGDTRPVGAYTQLHEKFLRDGGLEFRSRCASILGKLGFSRRDFDLPLGKLSGGQQTRLALGRQLCREPDILLLDEPTNHLDIETLGWLEDVLASWKKCLLVISHDRYFLDRVTNKTLVMEYGRAKLYPGNYTAALALRAAERESLQRLYDKQQKELAHHEAVIEQQRRWGQERNFVTIRARQKIIDRMDLVDRPREAPKPIRMKFTSSIASGGEVLSVRGLTMGFGDRRLFTDMNFLLKRDERAFIIGPNGCGKSTLIKLLLGQLEPLSGRIEAGYNVQVGYYDQENQNLTPENSVLDELWNAYPQKTETEIRNALGLFRFIGEDVFKPVSVLSGGQRARLTLCKLILSEMNLLILDEPTNHLDIDSREALETALLGFPGTVLIVSHDLLATRIIELSPGPAFAAVIADYRVSHAGDGYNEYLAFKTDRLDRIARGELTVQSPMPAGETAPAPHVPTLDDVPDLQGGGGKDQYLRAKQAASDARKKQHRIEKLKEEKENLETELAQVEADLYGEAAADYQKAAALDARRTEIEERLMEVYEALEQEGEEV